MDWAPGYDWTALQIHAANVIGVLAAVACAVWCLEEEA